MGLAIGVDIGGTKVAAGVVDDDGHILARLRRDTPAHDPAKVEEVIADCIRVLAADQEVEAGSAPSLQEEELLDQQARAAYRQRIAELTEELEEAQGWGDTERAAPARREIDAITEQLAAAVGLGGRDRRAASEAERAGQRDRGAQVGDPADRAQDAELGEHPAHSVKAGIFVAYDPDPTVSISWAV